MPVSDFRINSRVRSVFARHWVDLQKVRFASFRGTVRVSGEISILGSHAAGQIDPAKISVLETEIRQIKEVKQVFFELIGWRRGGSGEWEYVGSRTGTGGCTVPEDGDDADKENELEFDSADFRQGVEPKRRSKR